MLIIRSLVFLLFPLALQAAPPRPNVILMMGDDHGWEETGYHGHPHVKTPVLDQMAAAGLRLDRFYAAHPSCSPTRASFLTGRHPNRMGTFSPGWSFRPEEITVAHLMGQADYRCAHFGKWHVGAVKAESPVSPLSMGFHECLSHDNFFELNPTLSRNGGPPERLEGESSDILIRETIAFMDRAHATGKPFFSVVWFGSPHEPYSGLPEDLALYDDLVDQYPKKVKLTSNETGGQVQRPQGEVLRERYAEITAMDRAIGKLRSYLAAKGLRDNTLLFYCGDNGTSPDAVVASPHRGHKGDVYEGGVLVPGIIEWPARIPKPQRSAFPASTSDLLPTLAAITGLPLPHRPVDGMDLSAVMDGKAPAEREKPLYFWSFNTGRINKTKLTPYLHPQLQQGTTPLAKKSGGKATRDFTNFHHAAITDADYLGPRAITDGAYKLILQEPQEMLFNLEIDPGETKNLIQQEAARADELRVKLRGWQDSVLNSLTGKDYAK